MCADTRHTPRPPSSPSRWPRQRDTRACEHKAAARLGGIELKEHLVPDSKNGKLVVGNGDKLSDVAILGVGSRHVFGSLVVGYDVVVIRVGPHTRCELLGLDLLVRGRRGRHKTDAVVVGGEDELGEIHCVEGKGGKYRAMSWREWAIAVAGGNCG